MKQGKAQSNKTNATEERLIHQKSTQLTADQLVEQNIRSDNNSDKVKTKKNSRSTNQGKKTMKTKASPEVAFSKGSVSLS